MVRSVVLILALLAFVPTAAASAHGEVGMGTSLMVAVLIAAGGAFFALVFAVTAPKPGDHGRPEQATAAEYAAGLAVAVATVLLVLAQFLPWGSVAFTTGDSRDVYPWGYGGDLTGSGSWFGVDGAGHIDLKVAMVLHYVALVALLPVILLVWRRPHDTRRTALVLAGLAAAHSVAFFFHMQGATAAVNDSRFTTSWGGWLAMLGVLSIATATLLVARYSSAVRPPPPVPILDAPLPDGSMPTAAGAGWASSMLDRAAQPSGPMPPRWAGGPPVAPQRAAAPSGQTPLPPAPWDPPAEPAPTPEPTPSAPPQSDLVRLRCPKCQTMVEAVRGVRPICPGCGFGRP